MKRKSETIDIVKLAKRNESFFGALFSQSELFADWLKQNPTYQDLVNKFNKKSSDKESAEYIKGKEVDFFQEHRKVADFLIANAKEFQRMAKSWNKFENEKYLTSIVKRLNRDKLSYDQEGRASISSLIDNIIQQLKKVDLSIDNKKYRKEVKKENLRINRAALKISRENREYLDQLVNKLEERIQEFKDANKDNFANFYSELESSIKKVDLNLKASAYKTAIEDLLYEPLLLLDEKKIYLDPMLENLDGMIKEFQESGERKSARVFLNLKDKIENVDLNLEVDEYKESIRQLLDPVITNLKYQNSIVNDINSRVSATENIVAIAAAEKTKSSIKAISLDKNVNDYRREVARVVNPVYETRYISLANQSLINQVVWILDRASESDQDNEIVRNFEKEFDKINLEDEDLINKLERVLSISYPGESNKLKLARKNCLQIIDQFCMQKFDEIVSDSKVKIDFSKQTESQRKLFDVLTVALTKTKDSKTRNNIQKMLSYVQFVDLDVPVYRGYLKDKLTQFLKESPTPLFKKFFAADNTVANAVNALIEDINKKDREYISGYRLD